MITTFIFQIEACTATCSCSMDARRQRCTCIAHRRHVVQKTRSTLLPSSKLVQSHVECSALASFSFLVDCNQDRTAALARFLCDNTLATLPRKCHLTCR